MDYPVGMMKTHILPFGGPAWGRRREIIDEMISARPGHPHDYGRVLYLTPNERKLGTLKAIFLEALEAKTGARGCIPPRFAALNRFIRSHLVSTSRRPVVDEVTRGLVLEELCAKAVTRIGASGLEPEAAGPSLAGPVGSALDLLYLHGVDEGRAKSALGDGLPARLLMEVKREYEAWLRAEGMADISMLKGAYRPGPDDFPAYDAVIIDGFYDADPCETRVLAALAGPVAGCVFILEAPGLQGLASRDPGMPYFGTDILMRAVGAGDETVTADAEAEAEAYSRALFAGRLLSGSLAAAKALPDTGREIKAAGATNPAEEVYLIAAEIKQAYLDGKLTDPGRVLVFFPSPDEYLPLVEETFRGMGIPYHLSPGYPLAQSPVVSALTDLLALPAEGYTYRGMRRALSSPLVDVSPPGDTGGNRPGAFDAFAKRERIPGGRRRWLERLEDREDASDEAGAVRPVLTRLFGITAPFERGRARLSDWVAAVRTLLAESGIEAPVYARAVDMPGLPAAYEGLVSALEALGEAASRLVRRVDLAEFMYILRKTVSGLRYSPGPDRVAGVRVLSRLETLSEPFDMIFAGGLLEREIPQARAVDVFLPDDARERLGLPASSQARSRDARVFLGMLLGAPKVVLSYPESSGGQAKPPSPYIRALEPFYRAGKVTRQERFSRPLEPDKALGTDGLLRTLGIGAAACGTDPARAIDGLCGGISSGASACDPALVRALEAARRAVSPAPAARPPAPPGKSEFSVTELEEYLTCGYRYYQARIIRSAPEEEPEDDIAPHRAGSIVHRILDAFYKRHDGPVTPGNSAAALGLLLRIAGERFDGLPRTPRNTDLRRRFMESIAPRFIEAEAALSSTGYRVYATELPVRAEVEDGEGGHVVITGKIDRLEMDEAGNFIVADYKTGSYPGFGKPLGRQFQLPLYACLVKMGAAGEATGRPVCTPAGLVYYNLKEGTMRDVVLYDAGFPQAATANTPKRDREKDAAEVERVLTGCLGRALGAAKGIREGRFEADCEDPRVCERCEFVPVCVKGERVADEGVEEAGAEENPT